MFMLYSIVCGEEEGLRDGDGELHPVPERVQHRRRRSSEPEPKQLCRQ